MSALVLPKGCISAGCRWCICAFGLPFALARTAPSRDQAPLLESQNGRVYSLCERPVVELSESVLGRAASLVVYVANAAVSPAGGVPEGGWEFRAGVFAEPRHESGEDRQMFRGVGSQRAQAVFGTTDLDNFTDCYGVDLLHHVTSARCNAGSGWAVGMVNVGVESGVAHVLCGAAGELRGARLTVHLLFTFRSRRSVGVEVSLCRALQPPVAMSACTRPLYDAPYLLRTHPTLIDDWITYHEALGVQRFHIYDVDGSFAAVSEYASVQYWPSANSLVTTSQFQALSQGHPFCMQHYIYSHCLISNFGLADWVLLISANDEYVNPSDGENLRRPFFPEFFNEWLNGSGWSRSDLSELHMVSYNFASTQLSVGRGSVVASSLIRAEHPDSFRGAPIVNPDFCILQNGHRCTLGIDAYGRKFTDKRRLLLPSDFVKMNHYVELLPEQHGRCSRIGLQTCTVSDTSLLWVARRFRSTVACSQSDGSPTGDVKSGSRTFSLGDELTWRAACQRLAMQAL